MPDVKQVGHALQLYTEAGVPTKQFIGVPVFQAEGLTVTTQEMVRAALGKQAFHYFIINRLSWSPFTHPALVFYCLCAQQYVPLFLAKEDLDIAVQSAYKQRNAAQIKLYRDKANKFDEEYNQVGKVDLGANRAPCRKCSA